MRTIETEIRDFSADDFDELDDLISDFARDPAARSAQDDADAIFYLIKTLRDCREALELRQGDVAERMGTTQSAISKLEGGASDPHLSTLMRYARAVGAKIALRASIDGARAGGDTSQWVKTVQRQAPRTHTIRPLERTAVPSYARRSQIAAGLARIARTA